MANPRPAPWLVTLGTIVAAVFAFQQVDLAKTERRQAEETLEQALATEKRINEAETRIADVEANILSLDTGVGVDAFKYITNHVEDFQAETAIVFHVMNYYCDQNSLNFNESICLSMKYRALSVLMGIQTMYYLYNTDSDTVLKRGSFDHILNDVKERACQIEANLNEPPRLVAQDFGPFCSDGKFCIAKNRQDRLLPCRKFSKLWLRSPSFF